MMLWLPAGLALMAVGLVWAVGWFASKDDEPSAFFAAFAFAFVFLALAGLLVYDEGAAAGDAEAVERVACERAGGAWYSNGVSFNNDRIYCLESLRPLTHESAVNEPAPTVKP